MKLVYLKRSLDISREDYGTDDMAMWNVIGANHPMLPDHTTVTLNVVKALRYLGVDGVAALKHRGVL